jgi:hypothetical protein
MACTQATGPSYIGFKIATKWGELYEENLDSVFDRFTFVRERVVVASPDRDREVCSGLGTTMASVTKDE